MPISVSQIFDPECQNRNVICGSHRVSAGAITKGKGQYTAPLQDLCLEIHSQKIVGDGYSDEYLQQ